MAGSRRDTLVIEVLRVMREALMRGERLTTAEVVSRLPEQRRWYYDFYRHLALLEDEVESIIRQLTDLGLVREDRGDCPVDGAERWTNGLDWTPGGGGGNEGGRGTDGPGQPRGGDGGGGGIKEVLGHPVLFALPAADFNAVLENLFVELD